MYVHVDVHVHVCVGMCISDSPGILCTLTSWHCEYTCTCMCWIERVRMMDVAKQSNRSDCGIPSEVFDCVDSHWECKLCVNKRTGIL